MIMAFKHLEIDLRTVVLGKGIRATMDKVGARRTGGGYTEIRPSPPACLRTSHTLLARASNRACEESNGLTNNRRLTDYLTDD